LLFLAYTRDERARKLLGGVASGVVEGYTCDLTMAELLGFSLNKIIISYTLLICMI